MGILASAAAAALHPLPIHTPFFCRPSLSPIGEVASEATGSIIGIQMSFCIIRSPFLFEPQNVDAKVSEWEMKHEVACALGVGWEFAADKQFRFRDATVAMGSHSISSDF